MTFDTFTVHGDADLDRAISRFMQRTTPKPGVGLKNLHALVTTLGAVGGGTIPDMTSVVVPVVKPCRILEWTADANLAGSADITVEYAVWAIPRVWTVITTNPATLPAIVGADVAGSDDLDGWTLLLDRKGAIRITVDTATAIEQITFVLYVHDLPRGLA